MKKISALIIAIMMCCIVFVGCADNKSNPKESTKSTEQTQPTEKKVAFDGAAEEVLDAVVKKAIELDTDKEYGIKSIECTNVPVDEDSCTDILGLSTEDFKSKVEAAIESKPNGSWYNHSIVVIKAKDGVDTAKLADEIIKNTSPSRFGCLKAESIIGGYAGQYIVFTASSSASAEAVYAAFSALSGIAPVRIDRTNDWSGGGFFG